MSWARKRKRTEDDIPLNRTMKHSYEFLEDTSFIKDEELKKYDLKRDDFDNHDSVIIYGSEILNEKQRHSLFNLVYSFNLNFNERFEISGEDKGLLFVGSKNNCFFQITNGQHAFCKRKSSLSMKKRVFLLFTDNCFLLIYKVINHSSIKVDVWLLDKLLVESSDITVPYKQPNRAVIHIMHEIFSYPMLFNESWYSSEQPREVAIENIYKIFSEVSIEQNEINKSDTFKNPEALLPELRGYQKRAVEWMHKREIKSDIGQQTHPCWVFCKEFECIYDFTSGIFSKATQLPLLPQCTGGILADEMGLGKTVVVLALALTNERQNSFLKSKPCAYLSESTLIDGFETIKDESDIPFANMYKNHWLCKCGGKGDPTDSVTLICNLCGCKQHSECVAWYTKKWSKYPFYCAYCRNSAAVKKIPSRGTVIVCPDAISEQWVTEINKHVKENTVKVHYFKYTGVNGYVNPYELADNDFVIVTYETLMREVNYSNLTRMGKLRRPKVYVYSPSPLLSIEWWRICLDEAQMVESVTTKSAEMASNLHTVYRWCVTGTPIQKSINSLYGLFSFINQEPACHQFYWDYYYALSYNEKNMEPMKNLLSQCFWRNDKSTVSDELGLDDPVYHLKKVNFTEIEKYAYDRMKNQAGKYDKYFYHSLIQLRHQCIYPSVGSKRCAEKWFFQTTDLLERLIMRTKCDCEEPHRKIISSLNGQAGINLIRGDYDIAIEQYKNVLETINKYRKIFRTDKLQHYHALWNLADVLKTKGVVQLNNCSETVETVKTKTQVQQEPSTSHANSVDIDHEMREDESYDSAEEDDLEYKDNELILVYEKIKKEYLKSITKQIEYDGKILESFDSKLEKLREMEPNFTWWIDATNRIVEKKTEHRLSQRLKDVTKGKHNGKEIYKLCHDHEGRNFTIPAFNFAVLTFMDKLREAYVDLKNHFSVLSLDYCHEKLNDAIECHFRPENDSKGVGLKRKKLCFLCNIDTKFNLLEERLYSIDPTEIRSENPLQVGDEKGEPQKKEERDASVRKREDSELETALKIIRSLSRWKSKESQQHFEMIDLMKKEFKSMRLAWSNMFQYVNCLDQLNMSTYRYRKLRPGEKTTDAYILKEELIESVYKVLLSDQATGNEELSRNFSHLSYLRNLMKSNSMIPENNECPICINDVDTFWVVLRCSHAICESCVKEYNKINASRNRIKARFPCPLCRTLSPVHDIAFVKAKQNQNSPVDDLKGSYSSKIRAIVTSLKEIFEKDSTAKCLVFSSWSDALELIGKALKENDLNHLEVKDKKQLKILVETFKHDSACNILLMPISIGAKGLNITEANHVLLVEPLLNPSDEYQAIARAYRIGQKRKLHIHRFIMRNSLEENIYEMFSKKFDPRNIRKNLDKSEDSLIISDEEIRKIIYGQDSNSIYLKHHDVFGFMTD